MSSAIRRPFYMRPPWNILFDISKLEKLTPWNVNISYLLNSFLSEMERNGKVDFRASGFALVSLSLFYLMNSKLLMTLQEPPAQPKPPGDFVPPPLFLPLRHELTSTTIHHLLEVLDDVLKGEKLSHLDRVVPQPVLPAFSELLPQFDAFLQEIEVQMDKLYELLCEKVQGTGIIEFSALTKDASRMEAIQMFILLLFLAQDGKVNLWQNEETEELYIAVGKMNLAGNQQPAQ